MKQAILHAVPLAHELQDGADLGKTGSDLHLDRCLVDCVHLRSRVQEIIRSLKFLDHDSRALEDRRLVAEAQTIDQKLTKWVENLPVDWKYATQMQSTSKVPVEMTAPAMIMRIITKERPQSIRR